MKQKLIQVLPEVSKPARYTDGELHAYHKDWRQTTVKMALAFPDTYEIGMGNLGFQILYHIINQRQDSLAERVYMPWVDMQEKMKEAGLPLTALESGSPLPILILSALHSSMSLVSATSSRCWIWPGFPA